MVPLQTILPTTVVSELIEEIASDGCIVAAGCAITDGCSGCTRAALRSSPTDLPFPNLPFSFSDGGEAPWRALLALHRSYPNPGIARSGVIKADKTRRHGGGQHLATRRRCADTERSVQA